MTGSGGWPLNIFLTPDAKPFYGGTYFPPKKMFNRASWMDVLQGVSLAFREKRSEIDTQAEQLTDHLRQSNVFGLSKSDDNVRAAGKTKEIADNIMKSADREWGGFGNAPKFPQTFSIQYLLRYYHVSHHTLRLEPYSSESPLFDRSGLTGNPPEDDDPVSRIPYPGSHMPPPAPKGEVDDELKQALLSIDKMIQGGIYDQLGGGFARYSTDTQWLAPHFEKMLYDNALLVSVISEAHQLTRKERYREVIEETMEFINRELLHPDGGFYSALDADSEGVEGKFYVWSEEEVRILLGNVATIFGEYYDITKEGNWEETNILRVKKQLELFAKEKNISVERLKETLDNGKSKLMERRSKRIRPLLDDKSILGWNALMNTASSKAFSATGNERYRELGIRNMEFLLKNFGSGKTGILRHTWKNGEAKYPAFLDDYAFLIEALIHLQEITGEKKWLDEAATLTGSVIDNFSETETGFFYYTPEGQEDVIVRKKEVFDSAVPSGNSVMAYNLYRLALLLDKPDWAERAEQMVGSLSQAIIRYPTSFGNWANLMLEMNAGTNEITLLGPGVQELHQQVLELYVPHKVLMASKDTNDRYPLLRNKTPESIPLIWLCRNYTCALPVKTLNELISLINKAAEG
jgi:uncharacterized protein YyaL (SSP411 family)